MSVEPSVTVHTYLLQVGHKFWRINLVEDILIKYAFNFPSRKIIQNEYSVPLTGFARCLVHFDERPSS